MAAPNFPGKGAKPGMYTMPSGEERYYSGGNDFYRSAPGNGAQVWGELTNGSGWRGMSQFDNHNDGRMKGGVESQSQNPFAPNFQLFDFDKDAPIRQVIGPRPGSNNSNNASEINARLKQQAAEKEAALKRTKGNYDHSSGSYTGQDVALVPDSTVYSGRDDARISPTGVPQKGTNMSRSFNDLLATTNTSGYQPFSSNQLPTTGSNPFSAQPPKTQSFNTEAESYTGNSLADFGGDGSEAFAQSRERTDRDAFDPSAARIEGGSSRKAGGSLDEALADKAGIQSYMKKFSGGAQERAANRAFLDTEGSMEALRAKEAVNGVVYAQQKHYIAGENADGPAQAITRSEARDISSGKNTAAGLLESYKSRITEASKETPAEAQDPLSAAGSAVKNGFAAGAKTDFALNNNQAAPQTGVGPVVPTDQIPKDLSGEAGKKYLADLDSGRLFK